MPQTLPTVLTAFSIKFLPSLQSSHPQFQMNHLLIRGRLLADRALEPEKELNYTIQRT